MLEVNRPPLFIDTIRWYIRWQNGGRKEVLLAEVHYIEKSIIITQLVQSKYLDTSAVRFMSSTYLVKSRKKSTQTLGRNSIYVSPLQTLFSRLICLAGIYIKKHYMLFYSLNLNIVLMQQYEKHTSDDHSCIKLDISLVFA